MGSDSRTFLPLIVIVALVFINWWSNNLAKKRAGVMLDWHKSVIEDSHNIERQSLEELKAIRSLLEKRND